MIDSFSYKSYIFCFDDKHQCETKNNSIDRLEYQNVALKPDLMQMIVHIMKKQLLTSSDIIISQAVDDEAIVMFIFY